MDTLLKYPTHAGVTAFSTTRESPFSPTAEDLREMGSYAAFNVTHYCGDNPQRVRDNRAWLCKRLGLSGDRLIIPHQTHSANTRAINDFFLSQSAEKQAAILQDTDALVTAVHGVCIGISTADCVPLLLYDEEGKAAAAIHAGWRGTVKKIALRAMEKMQETFDISPKALNVIIGPAISPEAYEVGEEVATRFREEGFPEKVILHPAGKAAKPHIDLPAANTWLLEKAGIPPEKIHASDICTYRNADIFFSARRLGIQSGRIFTGILLH